MFQLLPKKRVTTLNYASQLANKSTCHLVDKSNPCNPKVHLASNENS